MNVLTAQDLKSQMTNVSFSSLFAEKLRALVGKIRPTRMIETGSNIGLGTTFVLSSALRDFQLYHTRFISIEVNPGLHRQAIRNLDVMGLLDYVTIVQGLSIPRGFLPSVEDIRKAYTHYREDMDISVDYFSDIGPQTYFSETDYLDAGDDYLGKYLTKFGYQPDFILLDSAGHVGFIEFQYVTKLLKGPCHIALDDIYHFKHIESYRAMQRDPRFEVLAVSEERYGFCIAKFTP